MYRLLNEVAFERTVRSKSGSNRKLAIGRVRDGWSQVEIPCATVTCFCHALSFAFFGRPNVVLSQVLFSFVNVHLSLALCSCVNVMFAFVRRLLESGWSHVGTGFKMITSGIGEADPPVLRSSLIPRIRLVSCRNRLQNDTIRNLLRRSWPTWSPVEPDTSKKLVVISNKAEIFRIFTIKIKTHVK